MIVENNTTKGWYSSFMIKYGLTSELIENHRLLFGLYTCIKLCHTPCPPELFIFAKDTASEVASAFSCS